MKKIKKYIALLLLAIMGLVMAPHELLHAFTDHTDTCDVHLPSGSGTAIGTLHQHCDILQLAAPTLYNTLTNFSFLSFILLAVFQFDKPLHYYFFSDCFLFLRGPPFFV